MDISPSLSQENPSNIYGTTWEGVVKNKKALNNLSVWVLGDSFTKIVKPYLNASFSNIRYLGHWKGNIDKLPSLLSESAEKPDLVLVIRVERSF